MINKLPEPRTILAVVFRRRRCTFGLRTLFLLMTLAACLCSYQQRWIRQRHAALDERESMFRFETAHQVRAPLMLAIFGEPGVYHIFGAGNESDTKKITDLFPEAGLTNFMANMEIPFPQGSFADIEAYYLSHRFKATCCLPAHTSARAGDPIR